MPKKMNAVVLTGHGGPEKLVYKRVPTPTLRKGEVLVKVSAASINNSDINTRSGWYGAVADFQDLLQDSLSPGPGGKEREDGQNGGVRWGVVEREAGVSRLEFPLIQGADISGYVVEAGEGADRALIGRRVIADPWVRSDAADVRSLGAELDGGFAELVAIPQRNVYPISRTSLSDVDLAAVPCAFATAENLLKKTRVRAGDCLLVTGASGGVGSAAMQLAKLRGARVVGLVGGKEKMEMARLAGADAVLDRHDPLLEQKLSTRFRITVCIDVVCGDFFPVALRVLCVGGRYGSAGAIGGPLVEIDTRNLIYKDLELHGATRYPPEVFRRIVDLVEMDKIHPIVSRVFPLKEIHAAQKLFQSKHFFGKIVLTPE